MSKRRGEWFDKLFAEAITDRLGDGKKRFVTGLLHLDLLPRPLGTLISRAEYYSPEITLPALQLFRQPAFYEHLDGFFRKFCVRMLREYFLPNVKVGEGVGQARKLVAWAALAIEQDDQQLYPQLIDLLDRARVGTKDLSSRQAAAVALAMLRYLTATNFSGEDSLCQMLCGYPSHHRSGPILADLLREATR